MAPMASTACRPADSSIYAASNEASAYEIGSRRRHAERCQCEKGPPNRRAPVSIGGQAARPHSGKARIARLAAIFKRTLQASPLGNDRLGDPRMNVSADCIDAKEAQEALVERGLAREEEGFNNGFF